MSDWIILIAIIVGVIILFVAIFGIFYYEEMSLALREKGIFGVFSFILAALLHFIFGIFIK
jgi:multisubunit Na+/H+ antiporter MnhG subunit